MSYRIKVDYYYFQNTINAPLSGYIEDFGGYDNKSRPIFSPIEFETVAQAYSYLLNDLEVAYTGDGEFSSKGVYVCRHGEYSRPIYKIVNRRTGKVTKSIVKFCDSIYEAIPVFDY